MTRGVQRSSHVNSTKNREFPYAEMGLSEYAHVKQMLGNNRVMVMNIERVEKLAIIRGNMRKRDWISVGDLVLVTLRAFQDEKVDIVFKYSESETKILKRVGECVMKPLHEDVDEHQIVFEQEDDILVDDI